jgi:general secretion pathway protein A
MEYYETLGFFKEPFTTTPDPDFFYRSPLHEDGLNRLEIAVRNQEGLCVIIGDVGTGKTTMSRVLLQSLTQAPDRDKFITQMIVDPEFPSEYAFLRKLNSLFDTEGLTNSTFNCKESFKNFLNEMETKDQVITLMIDEGHEISPKILKVLRMLLNHELNHHKLLNIIIFGQYDLIPLLKRHKNFHNRIDLMYVVNPLPKDESIKMIRDRIRTAGRKNELFTDEAYDVITGTSNIPRDIVKMCRFATKIHSSNEPTEFELINEETALGSRERIA